MLNLSSQQHHEELFKVPEKLTTNSYVLLQGISEMFLSRKGKDSQIILWESNPFAIILQS